MILLILVTPHVVAVDVTSKHHIIKNSKQLDAIWPMIYEKAKEEVKIPTSTYVGHYRDEYLYHDRDTALNALCRYYEDTVNGLESIKSFLGYVRRLFIVSGIVPYDSEFDKLIELYNDIGIYIEVNENDDL